MLVGLGRPTLGRRSGIVASALSIAVVAVGVVTPSGGRPAMAAETAVPDATTVAAETELITRLNADRAASGLAALRVDPRLTAIARARSADMASRGYFSHEQPDGQSVFDIVDATGIVWYAAAETIAWNPLSPISDSALAAEMQWVESAPHRAILVGLESNYLGVGSAIDATGRTIWTAVLIEGPDRTPPWARVASVARTDSTSTRATVAVRWRGADVLLASHMAGLRDFQVQRRIAGGSWTTVRSATTATSLSTTLYRGHRYEFRVRARDRAGNYSSWTVPRAISL